MSTQHDVTQLLIDARARSAARRGSPGQERLWQEIHDELRRIAHRALQGERDDHTLQTTALVHEAYLVLIDQDRVVWTDRVHFFATAARVMRHILIDYARRKNAQKRGGGAPHLSLEQATASVEASAQVFLSLDRALDGLSEVDERLGAVVECRFFGGMTEHEIAELLDCSPRTVRRDWRKAKAWLARALPDDVQ